jgi:hypothetical protein
VNGLIKTLLFIKNVHVIQLYELNNEMCSYTRVSLTDEENDDYMQDMCYPYTYYGKHSGGERFSIVGPKEMCRRRVEIGVNNGEFYYRENNFLY